jgi:hypothetical protein
MLLFLASKSLYSPSSGLTSKQSMSLGPMFLSLREFLSFSCRRHAMVSCTPPGHAACGLPASGVFRFKIALAAPWPMEQTGSLLHPLISEGFMTSTMERPPRGGETLLHLGFPQSTASPPASAAAVACIARLTLIMIFFLALRRVHHFFIRFLPIPREISR